MAVVAGIIAAKIGIDIAGGIAASRSARAAGERAKEAADANAADLRDFGEGNAAAIMGAATVNAENTIAVGEANAAYIEASTERNVFLYGIQATEDVRRHYIAERMVAGGIRARVGGSGIQTNTGSPLHYLNSQVDEGIRQRRYMVGKHYQTLKTMKEDGADRAYVTRYTAEKNAEVIMANGEANATIAMANAEMAASQQERAGELAEEQGHAAGTAAMIQGISSAIGTGIGGMNLMGSGVNNNLFQSAIGSQGYSMQGWSGSGNWSYSSAPVGSGYYPPGR